MPFDKALIGSRFYGDNRKGIHPDVFPAHTKPKPLRRADAMRIIEHFLSQGESHHGVPTDTHKRRHDGATYMWVVVSYCNHMKIPYVREGNSIYRVKETPDGNRQEATSGSPAAEASQGSPAASAQGHPSQPESGGPARLGNASQEDPRDQADRSGQDWGEATLRYHEERQRQAAEDWYTQHPTPYCGGSGSEGQDDEAAN